MTCTLDCKHELFGVQQRRPLVLGLLSRLSVAPPLFALTPEVGAAVHAGNVENGDALQGDGAEVQGDAVTLSIDDRKIGREDKEEGKDGGR